MLFDMCCMLFCIPRFFHELVCGVVLTRCCDNVAALNAMPMLVFLNKLMIFLIFGLWSVNVVQILWFFSFGCVLCVVGFLLCLSFEFLKQMFWKIIISGYKFYDVPFFLFFVWI